VIHLFPVTARTAMRPPGGRREKGFPIVRMFGIPISIDWTWLIIGTIVVVSLFTGFASSYPRSSQSLIWAAALFTAVLFFSSLVLHELSHSLVARARGLNVLGIRLFVFGGVSELKREPSKANDELLMAVVGPVTSSVLALVFWGARLGFPPDSLARAVATWLATINLALAAFNLLPGFPLDGGRILRAILWRVTGDFQKASRVATRMGSIIAYGLILAGVFLMFGKGSWMNGVWIAFIGWFLLSAANSSMTQVRIQ
jgi:Zn-dependent protease